MEQRPGMMHNLRMEEFGPQECEIAHNLATVWFVTNAGTSKAGKDTFPYLFLRPSDRIREKFSFFGNVLAVMHHYPAIDGRVLNAVERILSANPNRLDRLCIVLITNADSVDGELSKINGSSEARVLVPFKYQELAGGVKGKESLITNRLEKFLFTRDLFAISSALKTDRYFFGRKDDIQHLIGKYQTGENSSVFGLRRIGKTSVLWAVLRELKASNVPVAFIDCSDTQFHKARWHQTLFRIKEALFESNGLSGKGCKSQNYTEQDASQSFAKDLELVKREFQRPALLILDEVESLSFDLSSTNHWRSGPDYLAFWQTLRSIYQQNPNLYSFCLCGVNARALEVPITPDHFDNPLYRYVESRYLGFFTVDDVQSMIEHIGSYMGMTFDREVHTYLTDDFGGHPFLIRQAASILYKTFSRPDLPRRLHISKHTYREQYGAITRSLQDYVNLILLVLRERYTDEYKLLQYLAAEQQETFRSFANQDPSWVAHLRGYGLIVEIEGRFHFRINVVKVALDAETRHLRTPDNLEERWELLSEARNALEVALRQITRTLLRVSFGPAKAKELLVASMVNRSQIDKAADLDYGQLFDAELYFSDLRRVVEANWALFHHVFHDDLARYSESMHLANRNRADAHAKEITLDDFQAAMSAIDWLQRCVSENA